MTVDLDSLSRKAAGRSLCTASWAQCMLWPFEMPDVKFNGKGHQVQVVYTVPGIFLKNTKRWPVEFWP
jgi:hypothetical protein